MIVALVLACRGCFIPAFANEASLLNTRVETQTLNAGRLDGVREIGSGEVVQINAQREFNVELLVDSALQNEQEKVYGLSRSDGLQLVSVFGTAGTQEHRFQFKGKFLEIVENGYVLVRERPFEEPLAIVDPAWAVDAQGNQVGTEYEVVGDILVQRTQIAETAVLPVVADPYIRDVHGLGGRKVGQELVLNAVDLAIVGAGAMVCEDSLIKSRNIPLALIGVVCAAIARFVTTVGLGTLKEGQCLGIRMLGAPNAPNLVIPLYVEC